MKKKYKNILIILLVFSNVYTSSTLKSMMFPGWGELNEFNILSEKSDFKNIEYIKNRSNSLMVLESALWISFLTSNELSKSYKNDYKLLGKNNANVDWDGKTDLYAANVGNFNNFVEYNDYKELTGQYSDRYPQNQGFEWDWEGIDSNRLKYDRVRNKSEKSDKIKTYMVASLFINRIISTFDVLSIKRNHGRLVSFDVDVNPDDINMSLNFNF